MSGPEIFASVPEGRRLDQGYDPKVLGSVGVLRPATTELVELLRRRLPEIEFSPPASRSSPSPRRRRASPSATIAALAGVVIVG